MLYKLSLNNRTVLVSDSFYLMLHNIDRMRYECESRNIAFNFNLNNVQEINTTLDGHKL